MKTMVKDAPAKKTKIKDAPAKETMVKDAAANPHEALLEQMQKQNALLMQRLDNLETQNKQLQKEPEPAAATANPHEALLQQMQKQNALLMQRLDNLETQNKQLRTQNKKSPPRSRSCSPPRRSPRRRRSPPRRSPPIQRTPTTRKQPKNDANKRKRTPSTPKAAKIRKTIGDTFKARYDKQVLAGRFKDANNMFKVDLFEDCIRPMIIAMQNDEKMDTDGFTYNDIYKMGLDAVKKRQRYTPKLVLLCF